jgi:hypothetical protein
MTAPADARESGERDEEAEMAGTNDRTGTRPDDAARCTECGKERASAEEANEEVTHCEWCGAEYPVPDED